MLGYLINLLSAQENPQIDWQFGKFGSDLGEAGIIISDIDNDGIDEIISTGIHYSNGFGNISMYFTVLKYSQTEEDYVIAWISNVINHTILSVQLFDFNQDGF